ncbi:hypothetical protein D7318_10460 [Streptomyces radicis]|uniref:Translation initiation factor 2 n=1 Tax=Streptomyces radicis TaxID=1750517 RepID=A0ABX9RLG7_9ACTN|nr:hypothetical protein D7318_10460 [Streptomyces radicis]
MLLVVHNVTAATRLLDILPLFRDDLRIQLLVTCTGSSPFQAGVPELFARLGLPVLPWEQAVRTPVDLAISASYGGQLHEIQGTLVVLSHGAGYNKTLATPNAERRTPNAERRTPNAERRTPNAERRTPNAGAEGPPVFGMAPEWLLHRGRPIAHTIVLSHPEQRERLRAACPEAAPTAVLAGDPCYDRLLAARADRARFRRALGVGEGQRLVLLNSTWNPDSLFGDSGDDILPALLPRLVAELPADEYRVAAVLHPNIWYAHGPGQIRAWCRAAEAAGLTLADPLDGWQQALVAADCVLGDFGSVTFYAAALGTPVLLGAFPADRLDPASPVARLGRAAPALRPAAALLPQLTEAIEGHDPGRYAAITGQLTSAPGESATLLRELSYRLIGLPEPRERPALLDPLPLPAFQPPTRTAPLTVLTRLLGAGPGEPPEIEVARFAGPAPERGWTVHDVHVSVDEECADPGRLALAAVIVRRGRDDDPRLGPGSAWTADAAARHPGAALTVFVSGPDRCTVRTRDGRLLRIMAVPAPDGGPDLCDPAVYASALHAWLSRGKSLDELAGGITVRTGVARHRVAVTDLPLPRAPLP